MLKLRFFLVVSDTTLLCFNVKTYSLTDLSGYSRSTIEDEGFVVLWDVRDEHGVDKLLFKIRNGELPPDTFDSKLRRYYYDQTTDIEPLEVAFKRDLIVNTGLVRIAQLLAGKTTAIFTAMASGTGTLAERPSDTKLNNENWRVSMISTGFIENQGTTVKLAGKFPTTVPSATISESGAFDSGAANTGTMLYRTLFPTSSYIQHLTSRTFYSILQSLNQVAIT